MTVEPAFRRPREVSTILGVSQTRVYQLLRDGQLKSARFGARLLVPASEVARMTDVLNDLTVETPIT